MTPKEKAKRLVFEFEKITLPMTSIIATDEVCGEAKKCALICVDEILNTVEVPNENYKFWQQVKQEIELLKQ